MMTESAAADLLAGAGDRDAAAEIRLRQVTSDIKKGALAAPNSGSISWPVRAVCRSR